MTTSVATSVPGSALQAPESPFLNHVQWGMISFLFSEVAFFSTLIMAYVAFLGTDQTGPTPKVLSLELVICTTICLLSSSGTVHVAEKKLRTGAHTGFLIWWGTTIVLGVLFLAGTAYEWYGLITHEQLTISRNMFGSTFYTLVGFHALHVTAGVIAMSIVLGLALREAATSKNQLGVKMVSWYWHFVDGVWIVVFAVVYLLGR